MFRFSLLIWFLFLHVTFSGEISFDRDIRPILSDKCFKCHGFDSENRDADLRLDTFEGATADLGGYKAIHPGKSHLSELLKRITTDDKDDVMPPEGERLNEREIQLLKEWIDSGAKYETLWSYKPLIKPDVPAIKNSWIRNEIDSFILRKLQQQNYKYSQETEPALLLRRLSLDLTGLPPELEDVLAFEKNPTETTYQKFVDKYLNSKHFGERWATMWLDLARYGDSNGYQHDQRRTVWPYRDWVIKALNDDMPFDQFTIEQVAGDLLPNPTRKQLFATGFNRCGPVNLGGGSKPEETAYDLAKDRVNTIGTVFLGATLECAQCHNHKFDPITQKDYYRLLAYFRPASEHVIGLTDNGAKKRLFGGELILDSYPIDQPEHEDLSERLKTHGRKTVEVNRIADQIQQKLRQPSKDVDYVKLAVEMNKESMRMIKILDRNSDHRMWVMEDVEKAPQTNVLIRGDYQQPGDKVLPGTPASLHPLQKGKSDRMELANWLVSDSNPLTSRVMVNRFWNEIFGRGIVSTTEDFGYQGALPSHPELLDWLASEFRKKKSIKKLLKTIVLSSTYRQCSDTKNTKQDPMNIYLSRGPSFRMNAEFIRDTILASAGFLNKKLGGPPVYPPQPLGIWKEILGNYDEFYPVSNEEDSRRRSLYVIWRRGGLHPVLSTFDAPVRTSSVSQRSRTNTPLQALVTLNEPLYIKAANFFAQRIKDHSGTVEEKIVWAFRSCLSRSPGEREVSILKNLYEYSSRNENPSWFLVAHSLLNLDEILRKR